MAPWLSKVLFLLVYGSQITGAIEIKQLGPLKLCTRQG